MNAERFETLADAYGGDIARWPTAEQAAARAWLESHADAADVLAQADALDALLDTASRFKPGLELQQKVVASFPRRPAVSRPRTWVSGAALAAACAAGVIIGVNFSDRLLADPTTTEAAVQTATAFDGSSYFATETAG